MIQANKKYKSFEEMEEKRNERIKSFRTARAVHDVKAGIKNLSRSKALNKLKK